jgi:CubicO group peptidase (beta-lactamase class C family)
VGGPVQLVNGPARGGVVGELHGFCDQRFEPLEALFRSNQESGIDEGASLAATLGGELVVDLWAGSTDREHTRPWVEDTLVNVFSTSKVMVNIAVLMVYDRGLLDLDAPIDRPNPGSPERWTRI